MKIIENTSKEIKTIVERRDVREKVSNLSQRYMKLWWEAKTEFPYTNKSISNIDQYKNGKKIESFRKTFSNELKKISDRQDFPQGSNRLLYIIKEYEESIVGYDICCVEFFIEKGYSTITEDFLKEVKKFDEEIEVYDVFQAIRNVWIMNSIQILFSERVNLTPSIFAYSMLYPYSDNYLDDPNATMEEKIEFNNRFKLWLEGESVEATNSNEEKIYQLVKKIEDQFPRKDYPEVFQSLLAIHNAQVMSLVQQQGRTLPYEKDVIKITIEKGGTSVLADGYLVKGVLKEEEATFMFGYGVFLQFIDDLQDVEEDYKNGNMTIFSQLAYKYPLDILVNKLFYFIETVLYDDRSPQSADAVKIKEVIHASCKIMILEAISKNRKLFSKDYIKKIEKYSIVKFSYFKKVKKKFSKSFSSQDLEKITSELRKGLDES